MGHEIATADAAWSALDRVVADVKSTRAQIARLQAREARLLNDATEIVRAREEYRRAGGRQTAHDLPLREVAAELAAVMRLSDRTVQARMSAASTLVGSFTETYRALRKGRIDLAHAAAITDSGAAIDDSRSRAEYERILLEAAQFESPSRLRAIARVVAARIDPELAAELQRCALGTRRIRVLDLEDGMARLLADLPAVLAHAIFDRLTQMAEVERAAERDAASEGPSEPPAEVQPCGRTADERPVLGVRATTTVGDITFGVTAPDATEKPDTLGIICVEAADDDPPGERRFSTGPDRDRDRRSLDELRADIFADLVLAGAPTAHGEGDALASIRGAVEVTVPVLTLAGQSDEPALLAGYGPIDAETARELAARAPGWDRVMFHPHSGLPLAVDRYRPSAELRRFLRARDERCRFPGCTRRPTRCDIDHTVDHAHGGPTRDSNLAHFCRRHHTLKHATPWRVRQIGGGVLEWFSPTRRRYVDKPPSVVQFVPSRALSQLLAAPYHGDAPF